MFGQRGNFDFRDACNLCLDHPAHPRFVVDKLWSYFIPVPPEPRTRRALEALYRERYEVRPLLDAILRHPKLYLGPRMVKPPVVYMAGLLRTLGRRVEGGSWVWLADGVGQRLFYPPNVAGWDDERWLDTGTFRGRWAVANEALSKFAVEQKRGKKPPKVPFDAEKIVANAVYLLGSPRIRPETHRALVRFARTALSDATRTGRRTPTRRSSSTPSASCSPCPPTSRPPDGLLQRAHALRPAAPRRRERGPRAAGHRARHADTGRHGSRPAQLPGAEPRPGDRRLRRRFAEPRGLRGRDRRRTGRGTAEEQGARQRVPRRRRRLAVDAVPGRRIRSIASCGHASRSAPHRGSRSPRTHGCAGIPR